jgi:pimeloyl-ACP methyl ester carboxylesterase
MNRASLKNLASSRAAVVTGLGVLGAAATALWVQVQARRAERENPPRGEFLDVEGVRLHYVERGTGTPVVLIHGNAVSLEDFEASGLLDRLAVDHRVVAIDRPGFGHSSRPRDRMWTPKAQAKALHAALQALGMTQARVVGHSMGAMVAAALALDHPEDVDRLVLLGGYYYPTLRLDALAAAPVALPVVGDAMRYTVTAAVSRATLTGAVKSMFAPNDVPDEFLRAVSREMMLRPVQLRANAEDAAFMMQAASDAAGRYGELQMPVIIVAGEDDRIVDSHAHSARLHEDVSRSELVMIPGTGHMVHHAVPARIAEAVRGSASPGPRTLTDEVQADEARAEQHI